jgi:hypothetical protein
MKIDTTADPIARRIQKRGQKKKASFLAGAKINGRIQVESTLEATFACVAMIDPRVMNIRPQPICIDLSSGRSSQTKDGLLAAHSGSGYKVKAYTPDFALQLTDGELLYVETKPERMLDRDPVTRNLPDIFMGFGHRLILVTDRNLTDVVSANARHLRPYIGRELQSSAANLLKTDISQPIALRDIVALGVSQGDILMGILQGLLKADLRASRLAPKIELSPGCGTLDHLKVLPL